MKKFRLWHSLAGTAALIFLELVVFSIDASEGVLLGTIILTSIVGTVGNLYVAGEIVEEVRGATHMFVLLSVTTAEFIVFFAFQFGFMLAFDPSSFPTLLPDPISLGLQSVMVFVFNPLYDAATGSGRALILIETVGALGLVLFILQNVSQFRRGRPATPDTV